MWSNPCISWHCVIDTVGHGLTDAGKFGWEVPEKGQSLRFCFCFVISYMWFEPLTVFWFLSFAVQHNWTTMKNAIQVSAVTFSRFIPSAGLDTQSISPPGESEAPPSIQFIVNKVQYRENHEQRLLLDNYSTQKTVYVLNVFDLIVSNTPVYSNRFYFSI